MKVTLATVGSRGDVQPMFALAQGLVKRGHQVRIAASPNFAEWSGRLGLPFTPVGCDMQRWMADNPKLMTGKPLEVRRGMRMLFSEQLPAQIDGLIEAAKGSDAILYSGLALSSASVAEYLNIPVLALAYSPCVIPGRGHPPSMVPWQNLPHWINAMLWRLVIRAGRRTTGQVINQTRTKLGLAPVEIYDLLSRRVPWVVAADREVLPPSPEWAQRVPYANFLFYDDDRQLDPELDRWLGAGDPPIFVGFGSMSGDGMTRIKQVLQTALSSSGKRVLLGSGWGGLADEGLPDGWRSVGDVPYAQLFPKVAAVIHHGGAGTMAMALRTGVPQVVLPLIFDQYHHAARLYRAGLAPLGEPLEKVSAAGLRRAIGEALAMDPKLRTEVARRLSDSDGISQVAQLLERLAAGELVLTPYP